MLLMVTYTCICGTDSVLHCICVLRIVYIHSMLLGVHVGHCISSLPEVYLKEYR